MRKRKFYSFIISSILASLAVTGSISHAETLTSVIVDNDTIATNCSNDGSSSLYAYKTGNNLYNGDARYVYTSNTNTKYRWTFPGLRSWTAKTFSVKISMYLNDAAFNDPFAKYYAEHGSYGNSVFVGSIDQNKAPSGWSYVQRSNIASEGASGGVYIGAVIMNPSGNAAKATGADAIQVQATY